MPKYKFVSWNEDKSYSLVRGGLVYTLLTWLGIFKNDDKRLLWRSIMFALLAWLPLIILSIADGNFIGDAGRPGIAQDLSLNLRLLIVVPFLIWVEKLIDPAFNAYMNTTRRLVPEENESAFQKIVTTTQGLSASWIPEIIFIVFIYGIIILNWNNADLNGSSLSVMKNSTTFSPSAIYFTFLSLPIYQFLMARWLWRWIIWVYTMMKFSRMNLRIEASHADQMAGLEYLQLVPTAFCVLGLAFSLIYAGLICEEIIFKGMTLNAFAIEILIFVVAVPLVIHLPLFAFVPLMINAKVRGMTHFGSLIQYHNNLYREKWMTGELPKDDNILPSLDNSSLADINGSYVQAVKGMGVIPINRNTLVIDMLLLLIPFIPLIFTQYSLGQLFSKLAEIAGM